jgi:hypothetical protein
MNCFGIHTQTLNQVQGDKEFWSGVELLSIFGVSFSLA